LAQAVEISPKEKEMPFDIHAAFSQTRLDDRVVDELIGLSRGLLADGRIAKEEVEFLQQWLARNRAVVNNPVIAMLLRRIDEILRDGEVDAEESAELFDTLQALTGTHTLGEITKSTTLPLDQPPPQIAFENKIFCFTGTFAFGSRARCESMITNLGGLSGSLTQRTNFLIVGIYATDSWIHTSYGRKIEKAAKYRSAGIPVAIISEEHWAKFIP
jgi:NAD-dependent DNA ligase